MALNRLFVLIVNEEMACHDFLLRTLKSKKPNLDVKVGLLGGVRFNNLVC